MRCCAMTSLIRRTVSGTALVRPWLLTNQKVIIARKADRDDVVSEPNSLVSFHQRQVILVSEEIILGMDNLLDRLSLQVLVWLASG